MSRALLAVLCASCTAVPYAAAQSAENVAVVINEASPASKQIGEYYVQQRGIPPANVIRITTATDETIDRAVFVRTIQAPIGNAIAKGDLADRILYLVLTKGVPLRVNGTGGVDGTVASVDSELTLLYRALVGDPPLVRGRVENPYFLKSAGIEAAAPFTHRTQDIFLVSRLDGFTVDDVIALIDRAKAPQAEGRIVLDQRGVPASRLGDEWLAAAAQRLSASGQESRILLEQTAAPARDVKPVLGYYSWGASDPQNRVRNPGMAFVPGAIAATYASSDARTFREPPADWIPAGVALDRATMFAGSPMSLIGDLIRSGVTGVSGQVAEPYMESVVRPDILFAAYLAGFNLIESYYLAMPHLSWQSVVVGDPLCTPFPRKAADAADLNPPVDEKTTLPAFFSARRVKSFADPRLQITPDVATWWVRARALDARGNRDGAREALEHALALAPAQVGLRLDLATNLEQAERYDEAIVQYEKVIELQPAQFIALNNLAYALAVRKNRPADARPIAERALTVVPQDTNVIDTLAWIEHLLGDNASAARRLDDAARRSPGDPNIRLHSAIVQAALGRKARAAADLKEALSLDPSLADTDPVKELKERLAALPEG